MLCRHPWTYFLPDVADVCSTIPTFTICRKIRGKDQDLISKVSSISSDGNTASIVKADQELQKLLTPMKGMNFWHESSSGLWRGSRGQEKVKVRRRQKERISVSGWNENKSMHRWKIYLNLMGLNPTSPNQLWKDYNSEKWQLQLVIFRWNI